VAWGRRRHGGAAAAAVLRRGAGMRCVAWQQLRRTTSGGSAGGAPPVPGLALAAEHDHRTWCAARAPAAQRGKLQRNKALN